MNRLLAVGLTVALACSANAGGNPNVRVYIDFDPPNYVHETTPEPYATVEAYVCMDHLDSGMTTISFRVTDFGAEFPGVFAPPGWVTLLPGDLPIGWAPWEPGGAIVVSSECMGEEEPVLVGYVTLFYLGGAAYVQILDHPDYPRWVVDCSVPGEFDLYCVYRNGSIGGAVAPAGDCGATPSEGGSWGTIKSMYR